MGKGKICRVFGWDFRPEFCVILLLFWFPIKTSQMQLTKSSMKTKSLAANVCRRCLICRREPQASRTGDRKKKIVNSVYKRGREDELGKVPWNKSSQHCAGS